MVLRGSFGERIELTLLGYQFPDLHPSEDWYDANWLRVRLQVRDATWDSSGPALLTTEARQIVDWLRAVGRETVSEFSLEFIEPCLRFEFTQDVIGDWEMSMTVSMELLPAGLALSCAWIRLGLDVDRELLLDAADDFEKELSAFPVRGFET